MWVSSKREIFFLRFNSLWNTDASKGHWTSEWYVFEFKILLFYNSLSKLWMIQWSFKKLWKFAQILQNITPKSKRRNPILRRFQNYNLMNVLKRLIQVKFQKGNFPMKKRNWINESMKFFSMKNLSKNISMNLKLSLRNWQWMIQIIRWLLKVFISYNDFSKMTR